MRLHIHTYIHTYIVLNDIISQKVHITKFIQLQSTNHISMTRPPKKIEMKMLSTNLHENNLKQL